MIKMVSHTSVISSSFFLNERSRAEELELSEDVLSIFPFDLSGDENSLPLVIN